MPTLRQELTGILSRAFEECGFDPALGAVTVSGRPDLCDYQCNGALSGAKLYKKPPMAIASAVAEKLSLSAQFSEVSIAPPGFINLKLSGKYLKETAEKIQKDPAHIFPSLPKETIVLDYGGPNVAKPLHVGHMRTAIIGESIKRMLCALGHTVIGDIHLGDWGLQMGQIIMQLKDISPELPYFDPDFTGEYPVEPPLSVDDLNEMYPAASKRSKEDAEFLLRAKTATFELQSGRQGYLALWRHFVSVSIADMKKSYELLNVSFDKWLGESDAQGFIPDMIRHFINSGAAYEDDGALIINVSEDSDSAPMPPVLIRKSDGSTLYATTDLATIVQRRRDFSPNRIIYVVDNRQSFHFEQVFRAAKKTGISGDIAFEFAGFGTMNGSDGKPYKTREGGVMRLSDLIGSVISAAGRKLDDVEITTSLTEEERREISCRVGLAALKFGDLSNHRTKDYLFDLDRFLSFEGKTGPYLLYSVVRINSILAKAAQEDISGGAILPPVSPEERELFLKLLELGDALLVAANDRAPSGLCEHAFELASAFSRFYAQTKILTESEDRQRASYLALIILVRRVLSLELDLLAIDTVQKM